MTRFVDFFKFTDDAAFEAKHKRNENGEFAKNSSSKASSETKEPKEAVSNEPTHKNFNQDKAYLNHIQNNEYDVLPEGVQGGYSAVKASTSNIESKYRYSIYKYSQDTKEDSVYKKLNGALFSGSQMDSDIAEIDRDLEELLNSKTLTENVRVYKGIPEEFAKYYAEGSEFEFKGFMSTSVYDEVAMEFSENCIEKAREKGREEKGHVLVIDAPKGIHACNISKYSEFSSEDEILFQKGVKGKVNRVYFDESLDYYVYYISLDLS